MLSQPYGDLLVDRMVDAGETINITATFDWTHKDLITADWALHVYSEEPVTLTNTRGEVSS